MHKTAQTQLFSGNINKVLDKFFHRRDTMFLPSAMRLPFAEKSLLNLAAFGIVMALRR